MGDHSLARSMGASFEPYHTASVLFVDAPDADADSAGATYPRLFRIRAADTSGHRSSANILIKRMYAWRGYDGASLPLQQDANRITLTATDHDVTVGTITIRLDGPDGLQVDDVFGDEVEQMRRAGRRICEFTKLAVDSSSRSKRVLASLFHVAYLYAHRIKGCDALVIEVNPRHVRFYERMLDCTVLTGERLNRRVNAPAVLLHLDFKHTRRQIEHFGGRLEVAASERSLYPYAFSSHEEAGIMARLRRSSWLNDPQWKISAAS